MTENPTLRLLYKALALLIIATACQGKVEPPSQQLPSAPAKLPLQAAESLLAPVVEPAIAGPVFQFADGTVLRVDSIWRGEFDLPLPSPLFQPDTLPFVQLTLIQGNTTKSFRFIKRDAALLDPQVKDMRIYRYATIKAAPQSNLFAIDLSLHPSQTDFNVRLCRIYNSEGKQIHQETFVYGDSVQAGEYDLVTSDIWLHKQTKAKFEQNSFPILIGNGLVAVGNDSLKRLTLVRFPADTLGQYMFEGFDYGLYSIINSIQLKHGTYLFDAWNEYLLYIRPDGSSSVYYLADLDPKSIINPALKYYMNVSTNESKQIADQYKFELNEEGAPIAFEAVVNERYDDKTKSAYLPTIQFRSRRNPLVAPLPRP